MQTPKEPSQPKLTKYQRYWEEQKKNLLDPNSKDTPGLDWKKCNIHDVQTVKWGKKT